MLDEEIIEDGIDAIKGARRASRWIGSFARTFSVLGLLAVIGMIIAAYLSGDGVLIYLAFGTFLAVGTALALLWGFAAVLEVHSVRLAIAIDLAAEESDE